MSGNDALDVTPIEIMSDKERNVDIYLSTIIDSYNYGTVLQAAATSDLLSEYGNVRVIDYCRPHWTTRGWVEATLSDPARGRFANAVRMVLKVPLRMRERRNFRLFVERRLKLCDADPFLHAGSLDSEAVYCVGSDQTWNAECNYGLDPVFFLENVPGDYKKISLSASFGRPKLPDSEIEGTRELLSSFDAISVRESSSVAILDGIGIPGSVALKDPVLLCRGSYWKDLTDHIPCAGDPYVLVYMLNPNPRMLEYARRLARDRGVRAKVVTFSPLKAAPEGLDAICLPSPEEWVAAFRDAAIVVTDSFHGTCFSLLFEKPMVVFNPPRFSVRLSDVLADFNLSERLVADDELPDEICIHELTVDWNAVRGAKEAFSAEAKAFLDGCFSSSVASSADGDCR